MTHTLRLGLAHSLRFPLGLPAPAAAPSSLAKCSIQQLLLMLLYLYTKRRCRRRQLSKAKRRRKCGQKTSAALMGEEGGERGVDRKGGSLTEVEHCVFDSSSFPPYSTPIPCGFVYVRRLCCVSVINEITLFLLLLLPPGISCFCLFVVSFCFCVIFFLLHFIVVVVMSLLLFVSCCCPLACRQSLQHGVRLRLWL